VEVAKRARKAAGNRLGRGTEAVHTVVFEEDAVHIPAWVVDLESFREWVHSDEVPEKLHVCFLDGEVWVDLSKEELFSHNQVKCEVNAVLGMLVKAQRLGRYVTGGMLLSHVEANWIARPDGAVVLNESFKAGRVRLAAEKGGDYAELEGTPDMVLEVVSTSSVKRDTAKLRDLYWKAGIPEYWIVDARGEELEFTILRRTARDYTPARKQGGWLKSPAFGKSFRLSQQTDDQGNPEYTLEVR
jgi:Uma2 family endonuclease